MNTYVALFASGLLVTFKAISPILAEAHAHHYAVDHAEYLESVVPVADVVTTESA